VKIEEVKSKTDTELTFELGKMKKELFELRFKARTAGTDPARIRVLKRTIARFHTVRHERYRSQISAPAARKVATTAKKKGS
jgi:ribosomal protein L29